ncbi:uncharacterized protein PITG_07762 [Phytophthora infestans T30-4]|uniref:Uncharacterized protein n=1 Tax=Phytophthora infestans (strain T30-4) TaxID=403677 RepID=D0N918_PHYIT|nr:uncharacterized protein PITG_07762 [Phytophthora infestans T30-4]EEY54053.1 hypothetical protein PITG_07762 [Phytophthora infestans T30-4]|eukprot:XP_002904684.1 hypothetical protein PITG_07762 [Phytophthora infestans T30-4]
MGCMIQAKQWTPSAICPVRPLKIVWSTNLHEKVGEEVADDDQDSTQRACNSVELDVPNHVDDGNEAKKLNDSANGSRAANMHSHVTMIGQMQAK